MPFTFSPTVTDSNGNTWVALTVHNTSNFAHRFWYVASPTVGAGHTFTVSGSQTYPAIMVSAWSGAHASPFDTETGNTMAGATSSQIHAPAFTSIQVTWSWTGTTDAAVSIAAFKPALAAAVERVDTFIWGPI
jgi:hypothetical protein